MIFRLHDSVSLLDCRLEGIRLPVFNVCVERGRAKNSAPLFLNA
jgi:hypothetical protein